MFSEKQLLCRCSTDTETSKYDDHARGRQRSAVAIRVNFIQKVSEQVTLKFQM
jgi:hypothetical protein